MHGFGGDTLLATDESQALGGGGLDADLRDLDLERPARFPRIWGMCGASFDAEPERVASTLTIWKPRERIWSATRQHRRALSMPL